MSEEKEEEMEEEEEETQRRSGPATSRGQRVKEGGGTK